MRVQCIIPEVNGLKKGAAIVVHKSIMRSVVKKSVYNDRIIAITLLAERISILIMELDLRQFEENYKIPKQKSKMAFGEIICSTTKSAVYSRTETWCNGM